jgi:hypothetical protein
MQHALDIGGLTRRALRGPVVAVACLVAGASLAASWDAELGSGQAISVDPTTNRALIRDGTGQGRPLWDGVHRLRDGSTITIRSGVVVPNEAMQSPPPPADAGEPSGTPPDAAAEPAVPAPPRRGCRSARCDELVLKSCGLYGSCADTEACALARQLRQMQRMSACSWSGDDDWSERQCRAALQDEAAFGPCEREPPLTSAACRNLLAHVCAGGPRCARSAACRSARELFELERAALETGAVEELEVIRPRCLDLLRDHAFFPPCR